MTARSLAAAISLVLAFAGTAEAQYVIPGPPAFGSFSLNLGDFAPGFLRGIAGGPISLSSVDGSCRGMASVQPSHVILAPGPIADVRIEVRASADSTMMVRLPDGRTLCDDDGGEGLNAMIETGSIAGPIYVWIGSYSGGTFPYDLTVTQVAAAPPPSMGGAIGPGGVPLDCGMTRVVYGSLRVGDGIVLGAHSPWTGPNGSGGYVTGDTNWTPEMMRWVGQPTAITSFEGLDAAGCVVVRVAADSGQYFWRLRDARLTGGAPPPMVLAPLPPPAIIAPLAAAIRVTLAPRTPVTLFAPGITTPTVAVWSPRAGTSVEFSTAMRGGALVISASVGGVMTQIVEVPAALASTAVVTATRRPDGKVLFRAERAPAGVDPGQQMLLLVQWDRARSVPAVAQQWIGTFTDHAPAWTH